MVLGNRHRKKTKKQTNSVLKIWKAFLIGQKIEKKQSLLEKSILEDIKTTYKKIQEGIKSLSDLI